MECKRVTKTFQVVGIKGQGAFSEFGTEVPKRAQQLLARRNEIQHATNTEIAFFEPKRDGEHLEGHYYVGIVVNEAPAEVPSNMEYVTQSKDYVTVRGNIKEIEKVHHYLLNWSNEAGISRDAEAYIVETYHPMPDGEEEVEVFLPVI